MRVEQAPIVRRSTPRRKKDRRADIVAALYRCIVRQGYAATSLSDLAREAGMSSSHLLYYFPGKDAVLEEYFNSVCERVMARLEDLPEGPAAQLDAIVDIYFGEVQSKQERAVMLDLFGQAVQNRAMRRTKMAYDKRIKAVLASIFRKTPRAPHTSADEAALSAYAMLNGLLASTFFDTSLSTARSRRLFRSTLHRLAGFRR